jgi:hypothetical protein
MPVVGFLSATRSASPYLDRVATFRRGLSEAGYVEGRKTTIGCRRWQLSWPAVRWQ